MCAAPCPEARLTDADFQPLLQQEMTLELRAGETVTLVLVEVDVQPRYRWPGATRDPFALLFSVRPPGFIPDQGLYLLHHPELGPLQLFFVPMAPDRAGARCQVVVS
jgi:hypothetical protein